MASAGILTTSQSQVVTAPAPVWFEAIELSGFNVSGGPAPGENYDPSFHEVTFIWTVRDTPLPPWSKVSNMVTGWNDPNVAYGKRVAFCFPEPGNYVVDLWAVDSEGTTAEATASVSVVSPDSVFTAADTIVFAQDGDFTGAPAGNTQVSTVAALQSALNARSSRTRVRFKPGETIDGFTVSSDWISHVDTWTPGSPVTLNVLQRGGISSGAYGFYHGGANPADDRITYRDLDARGGWDPTTETGVAASFFRINDKGSPTMMLVYDCTVSGMGYSMEISTGAVAQVMIANCEIVDWKNYGIYSFYNGGEAPGSRYALIGVKGVQNPLALAGGPKENLSNDHGPVRLERAETMYLAGCDFFSCTGWSGGPPRAANACVRLNSKGYDGTHIVLDRVVMEGGYTKLKYSGENPTAPDHPNNFLADRLLCVGTARTSDFAEVHFGGATFRNTVFIMPAGVATYGGLSNPFQFFRTDSDNPQPGNLATPLRWYNCTFVSLSSGGSTIFSGSSGDWSDFLEENNVIVQGANDPGASLIDTTTPIPGIAPRFAQIRWNFVLETGSATVANGGTLALPYAGIARQDELGNGPAGATDQAYWQAAEAAGDSQHMITIGRVTYYAELGHFTVSYADPANIVITNTSGDTWSGSYHLRLDRKSWLDTDLPPDTSFASPATLPSCATLTPPGPADTPGLLAYDDFFRTVRNQPVSRGAISY